MPSSLNETPSRFRELGYCVFRDRLPTDLIASYRASIDAQIAVLEEGRRPESLVEPQIHAADWRDWLELCRNENLLDAVTAVLGSSELLVLSSHLLVKPPEDGLSVAWHQDNTYWPGVNGTDVVTIWLAFDDVDTENGCMRFLPSTHEGYPELDMIRTEGQDLLGVRVEVDEAAAERALDVELRAGDFSIHDSYLIHSSEQNRSSRWRSAYTIRLADASTTKVDLEVHGKPVYYVRGDGSGYREGFRDLRAGKPLPGDPGEHLSNRSKRFKKLG